MEKFFTLPAIALTLPVVAVLCHAALHDIAARTIPDMDSLALAFLGLSSRAVHGQVLLSCAVALVALVVGQALWSRRWIGGGDVKLIAACCCLVAPARVPGLLGGIMCGGGALGVLYLATGIALRRVPPRPAPFGACLWRRVARLEAWRIRRRGKLPYGVAISGVTLLSLLIP